MTDQNDDLMQQLAAANPVDPQSAPSANDPFAKQLLESTMNTNMNTNLNTNPQNNSNQSQSGQTAAGQAGAAEPVTLIDAHGDSYVSAGGTQGLAGQPVQPVHAEVRDGVRQMARKDRAFLRSRSMLVGAAAAVLLLVGGLLVFSPDNTPSAVATVHSAAAAAADSDSGRITTTFALSSDGEGPVEQIEGRFDAAYAGSDVSFSLQVNEQSGDFGIDDLPVTDARLVEDILYVQDGDQWFAVDTEGFLGSLVADFIDPRVVLETVQELTETVEVGSATIDGVETTQYQSVIDLQDESLAQSGWLAFDGVVIDAEGEVTVDLYIGTDGVLNQLDLTGDVQDSADSADSAESGTFKVSMNFFDIGSDITIEAPADAEVLNPLEGFLGD